jgi:phosphoribosylformylglycinamidine cyclo-ligase
MDYREAGVDISAADEAKDRIKTLARGTFNAGVLSEIGSFGGMFRPDFSRLEEPVLVSSTDSVGTKTKVAILAGVHDTVGHDIVNHCVNDILVQGAVPLFFLDYLAVGKIDVDKVEAIVRGLAAACTEVGCPLIGGETAQMPDVYAPEDYDLAGFIVGAVDRAKALTGAAVREGDILLGLPSSGLHTNGYTLARKVLFAVMGYRVDTQSPSSGEPGPPSCWRPPELPLRASEPLLDARRSTPLAHITGGGFPRATSRAFCHPKAWAARVRKGAWEVPPLFRPHPEGRGSLRGRDVPHVQHGDRHGRRSSIPGDLHDVEHSLERRGEASFVIGSVVKGSGRPARMSTAMDGSGAATGRPIKRGRRSSSAGAAPTCQALIEAERRGHPRAAAIAVVVSNVDGVPWPGSAPRGGSPRPRPARRGPHARGPRPRARRHAARARVDVVCLAGYMRSPLPRLPGGLPRPHPQRAPVPSPRLPGP